MSIIKKLCCITIDNIKSKQNFFTAEDRRRAVKTLEQALENKGTTDEELIGIVQKQHENVRRRGYFGLFGRNNSNFLREIKEFLNLANKLQQEKLKNKLKNLKEEDAKIQVLSPKSQIKKEAKNEQFKALDKEYIDLQNEITRLLEESFGKSSRIATRWKSRCNRIARQEWGPNQVRFFDYFRRELSLSSELLQKKISDYKTIIQNPDYLNYKLKEPRLVDERSHRKHFHWEQKANKIKQEADIASSTILFGENQYSLSSKLEQNPAFNRVEVEEPHRHRKKK